jgi:UDP-N-acetylglucosamine acyltransferase
MHANISTKAKIGKNVVIEPFATIHDDVEIGDNTRIAAGATLMNGARIGSNCNIFPYAVIAGEPQDLKFQGEYSTAEIGDNTTIREFATINRGTAASGKARTIVGSGALIMSYCHVAHDCCIGDHVILSSYAGLAGEVEVGSHAIVGGGTLAHQFVRIGAYAMVGGGLRTGKDVPPFVLAGHSPMSFYGINKIGLHRHGFSAEKIEHIQEIYRIVYLSGMNVSQACQALAAMPPSQECSMVLEFIQSSKRGIIPCGKQNAKRGSIEF